MTEVNGTTPEFQGNPESGVDQLLNRTTPVPVTFDSLDSALAKIAELEKSVEYKHDEMLSYKKAWDDLRDKVNNAQEAFKEILAGDMDAKDIMDTYGKAMAEHLDWDFYNEVEIDITVTWRGTISLPFGTDVEDLDIDDFGLNEPCHNEYDTSFYYGMHDSSRIEER